MAPRLPADAEAERVVSDVLAGRPFTAPPSPWAGPLEWLKALWTSLERALDALSLGSPVLYWTLMTVLVLVLLALVAHIAWSLGSVFRALAPEPAPTETRASPDGVDLAAARAALAAGDARLAVELAWTATVAGLTGGALGRPSRLGVALPAGLQTPRQVARFLSGHLGANHAPVLERLLRAHERSCYAGVAPDAALAHAALDDAELLGRAEGAS